MNKLTTMIILISLTCIVYQSHAESPSVPSDLSSIQSIVLMYKGALSGNSKLFSSQLAPNSHLCKVSLKSDMAMERTMSVVSESYNNKFGEVSVSKLEFEIQDLDSLYPNIFFSDNVKYIECKIENSTQMFFVEKINNKWYVSDKKSILPDNKKST